MLSYTITNLGSLGGTVSVPLGVNNHGEVVGYSATENDTAALAFLYRHGRMTDLGTLGGRVSVAEAINDEGAVVGYSLTSTSTTMPHGFIDLHGRMVDLNRLIPAASGLVITAADDINDHGQIVAQGYETSDPADHLALLLKPTRPTRG